MMNMFLLYVFGMVPVFIWYFIHMTRKIQDVDAVDLFWIVFVSLIPCVREVIAVLLIIEVNDLICFVVGVITLLIIFRHDNVRFEEQMNKPQDYMG